MRIWHFGGSPAVNIVNGLNLTVWQLAAEQARAGHAVKIWLDRDATSDAQQFAAEAGIGLSVMHGASLRLDPELAQNIESSPPHVAHLHSVFVPKQAMIAAGLHRRRIPYVLTPNGGVARQILERGRLKKFVYSAVLEKRRFRCAGAITAVMPAEMDSIRSFCPEIAAPIVYIPNPVDCRRLRTNNGQRNGQRGPNSSPRVIYLGRFDVIHKGLDILAAIARFLPEVEFVLYGEATRKEEKAFRQLREKSPKNVQIHPPVYDREKVEALQTADLYIQLSRWEAFGVSIAEAMCAGLPCAVSRGVYMHSLFSEHDLGLVLEDPPEMAARQIKEALSSVVQLQTWSLNARNYALAHFDLPRVAGRFLDLYVQVASGAQRAAVP